MKQVTNLQNPFLEGCLTCAIYTVMNIKLVYKSVVYKIIHLLHCCDHKLHETTHLQGDKFSVPFSWVESINYCEVINRFMQGSKLTLKVNAKIDQFLIIDIFFLDNNI